MPISAVDTVTLAFHHTKRQLLEPFRFGQWVRLAVVGLLAGEMGSSGGTNFNVPSFPIGGQHGGSSRELVGLALPNLNPAALAALIALAIVAGLIFFVVMLYISSVMRFILFDSILAKECRIRAGWSRRQGPGWKYFVWQIALAVIMFAIMLVVIGIPALIAFASGWFNNPRAHLAPLIITGIFVFLIFFVLVIAGAFIHVLTKDFVVPQMALEGISAMEGWRRLWPMMKAETGGYAGYVGMKIVLAIGAGILMGIVSLLLIFLIAIPVVGVVVAAVVAGKSAGLGWNVFTITAAIVAGCILIALILFLTALLSVPVIVFFPAYSIYFFAPRYRPLSVALYPPPPGYQPPPIEPPPIPQLA